MIDPHIRFVKRTSIAWTGTSKSRSRNRFETIKKSLNQSSRSPTRCGGFRKASASMDNQRFRHWLRNSLAVLHSIDPIDVFPEGDQSEERIRFRRDPYGEFLRSDDAVQQKISDIARDRVLPIVSPGA